MTAVLIILLDCFLKAFDDYNKDFKKYNGL